LSGSAPRRLARTVFDRLESTLATSVLPPAPALRVAAVLGISRALLSGKWPATKEVAALFESGPGRSRRIALGIAANEAKNRLVVRRVFGSALAPFAPQVSFRDQAAIDRLRPPLVLVTAHVGALYLLAIALDRFAVPRVVLRWAPVHDLSPEESVAPTAGGLAVRTEALRRGYQALREGQFVVTAIEGPHGASEPGILLGRRMDFGRGAFALARASGARVVPLAACWEGSRAVVEVGSPIAPALAPQDVARWFDELLVRLPRQCSLSLLRRLLYGSDGDPAVDAPGE
jgi:hypothetical protein